MRVGQITQTEKGPRLPVTINGVVYDFTLEAAQHLSEQLAQRLAATQMQPAALVQPDRLLMLSQHLSPLARKFHEANFRLRVEHTGHQLDQRTISKAAGLSEHRHATRYFKEMADVGLGRYHYGRFYYAGERWGIAGHVANAQKPGEQMVLL